MVIGFSVMIVQYLLFLNKLLYAQVHRKNCTSKIMKGRSKTIPAFSFNTHHCREALLALPYDGEYMVAIEESFLSRS